MWVLLLGKSLWWFHLFELILLYWLWLRGKIYSREIGNSYLWFPVIWNSDIEFTNLEIGLAENIVHYLCNLALDCEGDLSCIITVQHVSFLHIDAKPGCFLQQHFLRLGSLIKVAGNNYKSGHHYCLNLLAIATPIECMFAKWKSGILGLQWCSFRHLELECDLLFNHFPHLGLISAFQTPIFGTQLWLYLHVWKSYISCDSEWKGGAEGRQYQSGSMLHFTNICIVFN